jgi:hypothetical protein
MTKTPGMNTKAGSPAPKNAPVMIRYRPVQADIHFHTAQSGSFSMSAPEGSGAMQIELRKGMNLYPGTYNAVIAPEKLMVSAINGNAELQRFLFLYISGNYSRILSGVSRTSKNFDIQRAFTAHQLFSMLKEAAGHTVILVEHDPSLFEGAEKMLVPVAGALKDAGRESLVIMYTPAIDRVFSSLMRRADRIIEIASADELSVREPVRNIRRQRNGGPIMKGQCTLEVS